MPTDDHRIREKLVTDYRMACPRGHTSLQAAETTPTAYCQMCERAYAFEELTDRSVESEGG